MYVYDKPTKSTYKIFSENQCIVKITDGKLNVNRKNRPETNPDIHKNERRECLAGVPMLPIQQNIAPKVIINPISSC